MHRLDVLSDVDLVAGMLCGHSHTYQFRKTMESIAFEPAQFGIMDTTAMTSTPIIAQQFDQDLIGSSGAMLKAFYESGQLWALLIGIVLGYIFKSAFSYG